MVVKFSAASAGELQSVFFRTLNSFGSYIVGITGGEASQEVLKLERWSPEG